MRERLWPPDERSFAMPLEGACERRVDPKRLHYARSVHIAVESYVHYRFDRLALALRAEGDNPRLRPRREGLCETDRTCMLVHIFYRTIDRERVRYCVLPARDGRYPHRRASFGQTLDGGLDLGERFYL